MAHNFHLPNLPYNNESLPNDNIYIVLTRSLNAPPTDTILQSHFNYVVDSMRVLDIDIDNINAGAIPGANDPANTNFMLFTNGAITGWKLVSDINCELSSINADKLIPSSVGPIQIQDGSISVLKLAPDSVSTIKILNLNVTSDKMADNAVLTRTVMNGNITAEKMADNSVPTRTIAPLNVTADKIANSNITLEKLHQEIIDRLVPIGTIVEFAGNTGVPANWLECNGQIVSRFTYSILFTRLGTIWGVGDGATTFGLPDRRGRTGVGIGSDNSTGGRITGATAPSITLGGAFGTETHTLTIAQMPSHNHALVQQSFQASVPVGGSASIVGFAASPVAPTANTGGGGAHPNVPPSAFFRYYIRAL